MQITKSADTSKYNYKEYGICFDESEEFTQWKTITLQPKTIENYKAG